MTDKIDLTAYAVEEVRPILDKLPDSETVAKLAGLLALMSGCPNWPRRRGHLGVPEVRSLAGGSGELAPVRGIGSTPQSGGWAGWPPSRAKRRVIARSLAISDSYHMQRSAIG